MSISPEISWNYLSNNPATAWPSPEKYPHSFNRILDLLNEHSRLLSSNAPQRLQAMIYLDASDVSIYNPILKKIQDVIAKCNFAPIVYSNAVTNVNTHTASGDPSALYLLSLAQEPSRLPSYRASVIGDSASISSRSLAFTTCYTSHQFTPIHCAALFNRVTLLNTFLEQASFSEAALNQKTANGWTPLMFSVVHKSYESAKLLLSKKAETNEKTNKGETALMLAVLNRDMAMIKILTENGVNLEAKNELGHTALMYAILEGDQKLIDLLLTKGADLEAKDNNDLTALMNEAQNDSRQMVEFLITRGAKLETQNNRGETALILAAVEGHKETIRLLQINGANLEAVTHGGHTALMNAAANDRQAVVKFLLAKGANPDKKNNQGKTALMLAAENGHQASVELLKPKAPTLQGSLPSHLIAPFHFKSPSAPLFTGSLSSSSTLTRPTPKKPTAKASPKPAAKKRPLDSGKKPPKKAICDPDTLLGAEALEALRGDTHAQ